MVFACKKCGHTALNRQQLHKHVFQHLPMDSWPWKCPLRLCNWYARYQHEFNAHRRTSKHVLIKQAYPDVDDSGPVQNADVAPQLGHSPTMENDLISNLGGSPVETAIRSRRRGAKRSLSVEFVETSEEDDFAPPPTTGSDKLLSSSNSSISSSSTADSKLSTSMDSISSTKIPTAIGHHETSTSPAKKTSVSTSSKSSVKSSSKSSGKDKTSSSTDRQKMSSASGSSKSSSTSYKSSSVDSSRKSKSKTLSLNSKHSKFPMKPSSKSNWSRQLPVRPPAMKMAGVSTSSIREARNISAPVSASATKSSPARAMKLTPGVIPKSASSIVVPDASPKQLPVPLPEPLVAPAARVDTALDVAILGECRTLLSDSPDCPLQAPLSMPTFDELSATMRKVYNKRTS